MLRASAFAALFFALLATPALADEAATSCAPDAATWAGQSEEAELPEGAATQAWECRVGRHTLTVRSASEPHPPLGECGACDLRVVTVWLDRRPLVTRLRAGDLVRQADRVLTSVTLTTQSVRICTEAFDQDFQIVDACETRSFDEIRRTPVDRDFVRVDVRAPFRWMLTPGSDRQCAALTADLATPQQIRAAAEQLDPSFEALRPEIDWAAAGSDNAEHYATFDIDNDGLDDNVLIELDAINRDELRTEQWFWTRGEAGHRAPTLDRAHQGVTGLNWEPDTYAAYRFIPIRWRGKVLLYARLLPSTGATEEQYSAHFARNAAAGVRQSLSRGLIELFPDGQARLVCGWTANARVEDRL